MLITLKIYNLDSSLSFEFKFDHHRLISIAKERNQGQVKDYLIQCPFGKYIRERERERGVSIIEKQTLDWQKDSQIEQDERVILEGLEGRV